MFQLPKQCRCYAKSFMFCVCVLFFQNLNEYQHIHMKSTEFPYAWWLEKHFKADPYFTMLVTDPHQNSWLKGSRQIKFGSEPHWACWVSLCVCVYWKFSGYEVPLCYIGINIFLSWVHPVESHCPLVQTADMFCWCILVYFQW